MEYVTIKESDDNPLKPAVSGRFFFKSFRMKHPAELTRWLTYLNAIAKNIQGGKFRYGKTKN